MWRKFSLKGAKFSNEKAKANYIEHCRCGICHEKLKEGDEWSLRPVNTPEEMGDSHNSIAIIVHRKCVEH